MKKQKETIIDANFLIGCIVGVLLTLVIFCAVDLVQFPESYITTWR